jgi:hypothetical protein
MTSIARGCLAAAVAVALAGPGALLAGQSSGPTSAAGRRAAAPAKTAGKTRDVIKTTPVRAADQALIKGLVVTRDEPPQPVKHARVRGRHSSGRIVGTVSTDEKGAFEFWIDDPGSYYLELVDETNRVLAVEDVGETTVTVTAGQVSTTIIRVPGSLVAGWGSTARTILGAAAASGVAAAVAPGQPASPER